MAFSCGNRPSSTPPMKTASNSSPLEACTVISCTASWPAWAWLSPASSAACVRKAASGDSVSPVSASTMPATVPAGGVSGVSSSGSAGAGLDAAGLHHLRRGGHVGLRLRQRLARLGRDRPAGRGPGTSGLDAVERSRRMRADGKPEGLRQSMSWLHTWSGLLLGWLVYAVVLTGTLSYLPA